MKELNIPGFKPNITQDEAMQIAIRNTGRIFYLDMKRQNIYELDASKKIADSAKELEGADWICAIL